MLRSLLMSAATALALGVAACAAGSTAATDTTATSAATVDAPLPSAWTPRAQPPAPAEGRRINRAIEMLAQGQPVYYSQASGGGYQDGLRMAATNADYITYEMEHGTFSIMELRAFMRGLVDAGLTRTGHRTPPVIVTLPVLGDDPEAMRANAWVVQQVLASGVHGILLCQAESVEAVRIFVEAARYPFAPGARYEASHRGAGSQMFASTIWGVTPNEYLRVADVWPLNPEGEVLLGVKLENPKAVANAEEITRIPGIAFAEWGPGDQSMYLLGRPTGGSGSDRASEPSMVAARARVLAATRAAGIFFLNSCNEQTIIQQLTEGTMICTGGDSPAAEIGRRHTNRRQPW